MSLFLPRRPQIDLATPVMEFYEDGEWLRIEAQGQPVRYIRQKVALEILKSFGTASVTEKSDLLIL